MFGKLKINRIFTLAIALSALTLISCSRTTVIQEPEIIDLSVGADFTDEEIQTAVKRLDSADG